jgi:UDP-galactopyranose mutase
MSSLPIIVFSHLRWDFVYQRPQHLLARLAKHRRVVFIEEPIHAEGEEHWEKTTPEPNLLVCRPRTRQRSHGFTPEQIETLTPMVKQLLSEEGIEQYVVWCYTAMAFPLAEAIAKDGVVFDVMDELSAFKNAPPEMLENERRLLGLADVVFTGGPSLYRAKKDRHPNVHCFSSSVDASHFGTAKSDSSLAEADEQKDIPHPRLGFYGVIDERMDLDLLSNMAKSHPEWQIVMVGPVVKIDHADLPRAANIHYMGQRSYTELPRFLRGWDLCLLPFAQNDSTKFISPTKTLEYMAAERQIVSTPIRDVAEPYGDVVFLGNTAEEFIHACETALGLNGEEQSQRVGRMREILSRTSWDATAQAMNALINEALDAKKQASVVESLDGSDDILETPVAIIGAGPTGLSAAYHLGKDGLLIDQNERIGGWCRSFVDRGFTFDYAGHIMFSNDPYVHSLYKMLLGDNIHWQNREAWIYSKSVYTRYPFQGALYGLPPYAIKECIVGAIEARFGSLKTKADDHARKLNGSSGALTGSAGLKDHASSNTPTKLCATATGGSGGSADQVKDCCGDGIAEADVNLVEKAALAHAVAHTHEPANFEDFIYNVWGWGIAKHFAIPYNRKIWAVDLKEMETSWLGGRVPLPDLEEMIQGALEPVPAPMGPNARFGYPLKGGFQALMDGFLPHVEDRLLLNTRVTGFSPTAKLLTLNTGQSVHYEQLVSTMPLPILIRMAGDEAPPEVQKAAQGLRHTSVKCVNIGVGREKVSDKHWIYYPEDTVFHRIFVQGNASPHCNPPGGFGFTCEITYSPQKPLPCDGQELIDLCIKDAIRCGFIREDDPILASNVIDMPYAYVVYDHARPRNIAIIREWLTKHDIVLVGRYSEWEYYNSDHAFLAGRRGAEEVRSLRKKLSSSERITDRATEQGWQSTTPHHELRKEAAR